MSRSNKIEIRNLSAWYGPRQVLHEVSLSVPRNSIFAVIGPANSGKTTMLKALNRTLELTPGARSQGQIVIDGEDTARVRDVCELRRRLGMVFPLPVGLPLSVRDNVTFAPRMAGLRDTEVLDEIVERCLKQAALWDEVKDRLDHLGTLLSGGQQQRLTIARALSHDPEVLCLDEFSIAIDPVTTMRIEDVLMSLKERMTIILITNLVQQARRLADNTCFINQGRVVQVADTELIFSDNPGNQTTYDYVHGVFG
jgi:phosphate transport system ATP-binding protein